MTYGVWVAIGGLAVTILLSVLGMTFSFGQCKRQIDVNEKNIAQDKELAEKRSEDNRKLVVELSTKINGNLEGIRGSINGFNREIGGLTATVTEVKGAVSEVKEKVDEIDTKLDNHIPKEV